jgi:hypothetical protein
MAESDLYPHVKAFLERKGYVVKGEVHSCDVVGVRRGEPPVVVELKQRVTLELILQGVDRLALTDRVYLAVPQPDGKSRGIAPWDKRVVRLCRRIGVGLMAVGKRGGIDIFAEPVPYTPRKSRKKTERLLSEHSRRKGDPNRGGVTRVKIVTAYRQAALRLARALADGGPQKCADLRRGCDVPMATDILSANYYGWFERIERGVYGLTEAGRAGLAQFEPSSSR